MKNKLFFIDVKDKSFRTVNTSNSEHMDLQIENPSLENVEAFFKWILKSILEINDDKDIEISCDYARKPPEQQQTVMDELLEKFSNKLSIEIKVIWEENQKIGNSNL